MYQRGEYLSAAQGFDAATEGYRILGDERKAAEMANNSSVAYLQAGQGEAALQRVDWTVEAFARAEDGRLQGMALGNRAAALEALGRLDAALEDYQRAASLLAEAGADDLRLEVMKAISALQLRRGHAVEALSAMQTGFDGLRRPRWKERMLKRLLKLPGRLLGR